MKLFYCRILWFSGRADYAGHADLGVVLSAYMYSVI